MRKCHIMRVKSDKLFYNIMHNCDKTFNKLKFNN